MPYHCRSCRSFFSAKTNTVMHSSKLGYRKWALAIYIVTTGIKGTSSMKLHRDLEISQRRLGIWLIESGRPGPMGLETYSLAP